MSFSIQFSLYAIHMTDLYNLVYILFQGNSHYGCCGLKHKGVFISNMAIRSRIFQGKHLHTHADMYRIK